MKDFLNTLLPKIQKMRDENAACAQDIFLSDGTLVYSKAQGLESVAMYDSLIETINCQVGIVVADPKYPSSCCAPQSCDQIKQ